MKLFVKAVKLYIAVMFGVAMLLLLMATMDQDEERTIKQVSSLSTVREVSIE